MTTAKAWRQKGTGRARAGALSVPNRYGGGVAFGPKPRHYTVKVNRKARRRALRAALSVHAARGSVAVLDAAAFDEPSTKQAAKALQAWGAKLPTLVLIGADELAAAKSFRNIERVASCSRRPPGRRRDRRRLAGRSRTALKTCKRGRSEEAQPPGCRKARCGRRGGGSI